MPNSNALVGMRCPKCGSEEPFNIEVTCCAKVFDSGVTETWEPDWVPDAHCVCCACYHEATVKDFTISEETKA